MAEFIRIGNKTININSVRFVKDLTPTGGTPECEVYTEAGMDKLKGDEAADMLAFVGDATTHPEKKTTLTLAQAAAQIEADKAKVP